MGVLIEVAGVSTWIVVVGTAGSGVSTPGMIGADDEAAKGLLQSVGTITNVVAGVAGVCVTAHWSRKMRGYCDAQKR